MKPRRKKPWYDRKIPRWMSYDLLNGLWSEIPLCCILFFLEEGTYGVREVGETVRRRRKRLKMKGGGFASYVQCDRCYKRRIGGGTVDNGRSGDRILR